jgi:membrane protease YdiL (CAAX protease family)
MQKESMPRILDWRDSVIALGLVVLALVAVYSAFFLYPILGTPNYAWILDWSGHLWFLVIPLIWYFALKKRFPLGKLDGKVIVRWVPVWIVLVSVALFSAFSSQIVSLTGISPLAIVMGLIFNTVLVGISEEFVFRGQIQTGLNNSIKKTLKLGRVNIRLGTILASVTFGAFHFGNIFTLLFAIAFGLLVGHFYDKTNNLWCAVIIHNAVDFLWFIIPILR